MGILLAAVCLAASAQTTPVYYSVSRVAGGQMPTGDGGPATQGLMRWVTSASVDRSGNIFIVEENRVRKIARDGKISTVAGIGGRYGYYVATGGLGDGGPATQARFCFPYAAVPDDAGNLYITDGCTRVIRRIGTDGIIRSIAGTGSGGRGWTGDNGPATQAQIGYPRGLAIDGSGNLYFTDVENHVVRKIDKTGTITTVAGIGRAGFNADGAPANRTQLNYPYQIALDAGGNLYIADKYNGIVRRVTPEGTMHIVAGNRTWGFGGDKGPANMAQLSGPEGVAVDAAGNVYIADSGNQRIRKVTPAGIISTVAGKETKGFNGDDGLALNALLSNPVGLTLTAGGDLLIADNGNHRLRKLDVTSGLGTITTVAGSSNARGDAGPALDAIFFSPRGIVRDPAGNLYVADYENSRIRKIAPDGIITTVAGGDRSSFAGDGAPAINALLNHPWGLVLMPDGSLLFSDQWNDRIRKVGPTGTISTVAGSGKWWDPILEGGGAAAANIPSPRYLARDTAGNLYVTTGNRVRKISTDGTIATVAGGDQSGFAGDGGPAKDSKLNYPWGLAADDSGTVYVADSSNHVVRKITSGGVISAVAGVGGKAGFSGDGGPATAANLNFPTSVILDAQGNLIILDQGNNRVRRLSRDGSISTIAGNGSLGSGGDGGAALLAPFGWPRGVALDDSGNIYIADEYYDVIRKLSPLVAARLEIASGNNQSADSGKRLPSPLRVKLVNSASIGVPGTTVDFAVTSGAATLASDKAVTGLNGEASVDVTLGAAFGSVTVSARVAGLNEVVFKITALEVIPPAPPKVTSYTASTLAGSYGSGDGGAATAAVLNSVDGVVMDGAGNVYFSDRNRHRVVKVAPDGTLSTVAGIGVEGYSGDGGPAVSAHLYLPSALALDANGNLLVTDAGNHRVRMISTEGIISTVAGTGVAGSTGDQGPANRAQLRNPTGVAAAPDGTVFIADTDNHRIRKISTDGTITSAGGTGTAGYAGDGGPATAAQLRNPSGIAVGADGGLYVADRQNHVVRRIAPDGAIETVAGIGSSGFAGDTGQAKNARLNTPYAVAVGGDANLYIADTNNHRVRRVTPDGIIRTVAGTGAAGWGGDGRAATAATLANPRSLTLDSAGNLLIADLRMVRRVELPSLIISTLAGCPPLALGDAGPAVAASLNEPDFAFADDSGNVYIADSMAHRIRKVAPDGTIGTIAGTGVAGFLGDGGPATDARLNFPSGMVLDSAGNLFVADMRNHRIRRISADGTIATVAGSNQAGFAGDGGAATEARLNLPAGLALDSDGKLLIADTGNFRIREVNRDGVITTVAGAGTTGYSGDGADALRARIVPYHIALDGAGNLYIADTTNHRVRKVSRLGIISTVAGRGTVGSTGDDGLAADAQLNRPAGVAVDAEGNLYIADGFNSRVRKVSPTGIIVTIAGSGEAGPSGDEGPGAAARLTTLAGISVDASGNVYIADRRNHRIRRLTPSATQGTEGVSGAKPGWGVAVRKR
jgi:sugar lactone lactonase YvrE